MLPRLNSSQSLANSAMSQVSAQNWRRTNGISIQILDNQQTSQVLIKQDVLKELTRDDDAKMSIDIGFFRYTANQAFVDARKVSNGGNDTSFNCAIQNGLGAFDHQGKQTQLLGQIDIVYQYMDGATPKYIYEFINKVGQYIELAIQYKFTLGFANFNRVGEIVGNPIDFGTTNYTLNLFIE